MQQKRTIIKYITHNKHIALAFIVSVICICTGTLFSVPAQAASSEPDIVPGEIIVVCNPDADAESLQELDELLEEEYAVEEVEPLAEAVGEDGAGMLLRMEDKSDVVEAVGEMNQQDAVAYAQPNFRYQMMDSTEASTEAGEHSDPYREYQYYLNAWDDNFQTSCGANVAGAWELMGGIAEGGNSSTREPVTIAVLDSGCQIQHEDLQDNIDAEHAYDAVHLKQGSDQVKDGSGHGTHVCGIAAAAADNGKGIAGASGNYARILPINVFVGKYSETKDMISAFSYLEQLMDSGEISNLHVINMSLGGYGGPDEYDVALEKYIQRMREKDVLTVCAGGNGDDQYGIAYKDKPVYPGDFDACFCVTSLDSNGTNSVFSDYSMAKDISAPGSGILSTSTDEQGTLGDGENAMYTSLNGTSMASPLVSGIAALIWADNNQLTCDQVCESIEETAADVNPAVNDHSGETGSAGAIDAAAALSYAREYYDTVRENLSNGIIALDTDTFFYDGSVKMPQVTITLNGKVLTENQDYILSWRDTVESGTASITATGIGPYIGTISAAYEILPADISKADITLTPEAFAYDGAYHFPDITVAMFGKALKWGTDYTPTAMSDGRSEGIHEISIAGKGNYTGKQTVSYRIGEEKPAPAEPKPLAKGKTFKSGKFTYKVTSSSKSKPQVAVSASTAAGKVTIPASRKYKGVTYTVTSIGPKAFRGRNLTRVTIPSTVRAIGSRAFTGCKKLKVITVKTKLLQKAAVKNALKGSAIATVKVSLGKRSLNKTYVKKYKKIFTKTNCGRKVTVRT